MKQQISTVTERGFVGKNISCIGQYVPRLYNARVLIMVVAALFNQYLYDIAIGKKKLCLFSLAPRLHLGGVMHMDFTNCVCNMAFIYNVYM